MTKSVTAKAKIWAKPELNRLGRISDVAGPNSALTNGKSGGFS
jgi:hypothetical protein